jgi:hypothetical protein
MARALRADIASARSPCGRDRERLCGTEAGDEGAHGPGVAPVRVTKIVHYFDRYRALADPGLTPEEETQ